MQCPKLINGKGSPSSARSPRWRFSSLRQGLLSHPISSDTATGAQPVNSGLSICLHFLRQWITLPMPTLVSSCLWPPSCCKFKNAFSELCPLKLFPRLFICGPQRRIDKKVQESRKPGAFPRLDWGKVEADQAQTLQLLVSSLWSAWQLTQK